MRFRRVGPSRVHDGPGNFFYHFYTEKHSKKLVLAKLQLAKTVRYTAIIQRLYVYYACIILL